MREEQNRATRLPGGVVSVQAAKRTDGRALQTGLFDFLENGSKAIGLPRMTTRLLKRCSVTSVPQG